MGSSDQPELAAALRRYRFAFGTVALLSAVLNVLLLGGSIYMMLVYDSVLPSHSIPTLIGLLLLIVVVYVFQGIFDAMRSRILGDVGNALDSQLALRVQQVIGDVRLRTGRITGDGLTSMRDLDSIRSFLSSSGPTALIDMPWILFFLGILFLLHFWLGVTALIGALILVGLTYLTDRTTKRSVEAVSRIGSLRNAASETGLRHVEVLTALGMRGRMRDRWMAVHRDYIAANTHLSRSVSVLGGTSRMFRIFLQSGILTVGALLVISGEASGGVIFASSILSARALAPVDSAIANWRNFSQARGGWARLKDLLSRIPPEDSVSVLLPLPTRTLDVDQLVAAPPGTQVVTVNGVGFSLEAGEAVGVIGPSGAGKTSLVRVVMGIWPALRGTVRLDGATFDQWDPERIGSAIGYLPQMVELLEGTVAENIARFDPAAESEAIIKAATTAGVHDMIVQLPNGYETDVGVDGMALSAGQRQRVGLARALYGDPFLVVLDEPNSNLDASGEQALAEAIVAVRKRGGIGIVIAHRPSALTGVSHVLFMRDGRAQMFGPRDEVLDKVTGAGGRLTATAATAVVTTENRA